MTTEQSNEIRRLTLAVQQSGGVVSVEPGRGTNAPTKVTVSWSHAFDFVAMKEIYVLADGSRL